MPEDIRCSVKLFFDFGSEGEAERVAKALEPDNEGFIRARLEGRTMVAEAEARSIPALLHTLDDYLACLGISEGLKEQVKRA